LKIYPVIIIPIPTTPAKINISFIFITFLRIINSGRLRPVTAIMKARVVHIATHFSVRALTRGITPAAFEYRGIPISTASGTAKMLSDPAYFARKSAGTYP
jgi:hypothetical protein